MSLDFKIVQGNTAVLNFTVLDSGGSPVNLTGVASIKWSAKKNVADVSAVVSKSLGSGVAVTSAANGQFSVTLSASDTGAMSGDYYHEAVITDASGNISTVTQSDISAGTMTVRAKITTA